MADISAIREGLKNNLDTIDGLNCYAFMPDRISVPAAIVGEVGIAFDTTFGRGYDTISVTVRVYVGKATDRSSQQTLDAYLNGSGDLSIKAALQTDLLLDGVSDSVYVSGVSGYGVYEVGGLDYLGAEFTVTVVANGS